MYSYLFHRGLSHFVRVFPDALQEVLQVRHGDLLDLLPESWQIFSHNLAEPIVAHSVKDLVLLLSLYIFRTEIKSSNGGLVLICCLSWATPYGPTWPAFWSEGNIEYQKETGIDMGRICKLIYKHKLMCHCHTVHDRVVPWNVDLLQLLHCLQCCIIPTQTHNVEASQNDWPPLFM